MRIPKKYGQSRIDNCVFCGKQATTQSKEGAPVCVAHKSAVLPPLRCLCGEYVAPMSGKYGLYFDCLKCGNVNARRIFENNKIFDAKDEKPASTKKKQIQYKPYVPKKNPNPKEITIRSDDPDYF